MEHRVIEEGASIFDGRIALRIQSPPRAKGGARESGRASSSDRARGQAGGGRDEMTAGVSTPNKHGRMGVARMAPATYNDSS
jgi:hypothetical protein